MHVCIYEGGLSLLFTDKSPDIASAADTQQSCSPSALPVVLAGLGMKSIDCQLPGHSLNGDCPFGVSEIITQRSTWPAAVLSLQMTGPALLIAGWSPQQHFEAGKTPLPHIRLCHENPKGRKLCF